MKEVGQFPRRVEEIENYWIALSDGCRLAARLWRPVDAEDDPVPVILEYLPYRKRDGTAKRDALTHPYFAGHGYACLRVDMRGNGESDGLMHDEYLLQEQDDALEVIAWVAAQSWCSGTVGMIGISWGGFNGLQVAARRPPALKAIITLCSTDDRYADDIHYKGGALLCENLGWASTMLSYSSRPPDPELVGEDWRETWHQRLDNMPLLIETWLSHPHRDAYWKQGSICEDFSAIEAAVFAVGGWADAYSNAVPRLLAGLCAPVKGLTGPWVHKYPHFAVPAPAIGFLQEALRWWDHWLKGIDTGVLDDPAYIAYMQDSTEPRPWYDERPGRWISEPAWPSPNIRPRAYFLNRDGLGDQAGRETTMPETTMPETTMPETTMPETTMPETTMNVCSPQTTGVASGAFCAMWLGPELPTDQREDDAGSLVFDSPPLEATTEIFGAPVIEIELAVDRPQAFIAARLCDVAPGGASSRVTYGVLNLSHRDGHASPSTLEPGKRYRLRLQLDDAAHSFAPGHRIRLALSSAYWPLIWPSPEPVTLTIYGGVSVLELPLRPARQETEPVFAEPEAAPPQMATELRAPRQSRGIERDVASGEQIIHLVNDFGEYRIEEHGLATGEIARETYSIKPDDPLSARMETHWTETLERGEWRVRTETRSVMWADGESFHIRAELEAYENGERIHHKTWETSVPRDCV